MTVNKLLTVAFASTYLSAMATVRDCPTITDFHLIPRRENIIGLPSTKADLCMVENVAKYVPSFAGGGVSTQHVTPA